MKVYTEIIYTWDDNKGELVEESSKSYDYEGEVTQCWGGSFWSAVETVTGGAITGEGAETTLTGGVKVDTEAIKKQKAIYDAAIAEGNALIQKFIADAAAAQTALANDIGDDPAGDLSDNLQDTFGDDPIGDTSEYLGDVLGDDPVGDIKVQADKAETSINETVATTMDTGQSNLEGVLESNTGEGTGLGDLETGINLGIKNANTLLEGAQTVIHAVNTGAIAPGIDAILNINNPNSLISSPQNWYEQAAGVGIGGWDTHGGDPFGLQDHNMNILATTINDVYRPDLWGPFPDDEGGGGGGGTSPGPGTTTNYQGLEGDPFGNMGSSRRLTLEQKKFPQQMAGQAPSLVNQKQKILA